MNFYFPNVFNSILTILLIFFGILTIVSISNGLTGLLETIVSNFKIIIIFHLFVICFLYHFLHLFIIYLGLQNKSDLLDNIYVDTIIFIGPTIGASSNYIGRFVKDYLSGQPKPIK